MKCTSNRYTQKKVITVFACVLTLAFAFSGCGGGGGSTATTPPASTTVNITGKTIIDDDPLTPLADVTIKGFYSDTDTTSSVTSATDGSFTLPVEINKAVSAQTSKPPTYATLNLAKRAFPASINAGNIELVTVSDVNLAIEFAFGEGITLNGFAWLAVDVVNEATGDDVAGVTITVTGAAPVALGYLDCSGLNASQTETVVDLNPCENRAAAYIAYFDVESTEVTISDGLDSEIIPVRRGQVSFHEFEQ